MNQSDDVDPDILEAIEDALSNAGLQGSSYGRKFKKRIINKLSGQFEKSDLFDLIEDMPIAEQDKSG